LLACFVSFLQKRDGNFFLRACRHRKWITTMPPRDATPSTPEESINCLAAVIATRKGSKEAEEQQDPRFYLCRSNRAKKLSRTREETTTTSLELEHTIIIVEGRGYGGRNGPCFYSKPILLFSFFSQSRSHYLYNKVQVYIESMFGICSFDIAAFHRTVL
jgi:hypothetical protein